MARGRARANAQSAGVTSPSPSNPPTLEVGNTSNPPRRRTVRRDRRRLRNAERRLIATETQRRPPAPITHKREEFVIGGRSFAMGQGSGREVDTMQREFTTLRNNVRTHYASAVLQAAATVTLPLDIPISRIAEMTEPVSTANPFFFQGIDLGNAASAVYNGGGSGQQQTPDASKNTGYSAVIMTRSPLHSLFMWDYQVALTDAGGSDVRPDYQMRFNYNPYDPAQSAPSLPVHGPSTFPLSPQYLDYFAGAKAVHGPTTYPARVGDDTYFFATPGEILISWAGATGVTGSINVYAYLGNQKQRIAHKGINTAALLWKMEVYWTELQWGGFIAIEVELATAGAHTINTVDYLYGPTSTGNSHTAPMWSVLPIPGLVAKADTVQSISVVSSALLLTNKAKVVDMNGTVVMAQMPKAVPFWQIVQSDVLTVHDTVSRQTFNRREIENLKTGAYVWSKPADLNDFRFRTPDAVSWQSSTRSSLITDLSLVSECILVSFRVEVQGTDPQGASFNLTAGYGLNFMSTDPWYGSNISELSDQHRSDILEILKRVEQFHENPFHFSSVLNWLKKAGETMLNLAPEVLEVASAVAPEIAPVAMPLAAAATAGRAMVHRGSHADVQVRSMLRGEPAAHPGVKPKVQAKK